MRKICVSIGKTGRPQANSSTQLAEQVGVERVALVRAIERNGGDGAVGGSEDGGRHRIFYHGLHGMTRIGFPIPDFYRR